MSLQEQRQELERLGFKVVRESPDSLVALRQKWHWDCLLTKLTYVVFVRRVIGLKAAGIEADRARMEEEARTLDPSALPRGFQKGVAVLPLYIADQVDESARALLERKSKIRFAFFYLPAALDLSSGRAYYLRGTPAWGALYFSKFRFLVRRVLEPAGSPTSWPVSAMGTIFGLLIIGLLIASFTLFASRR